MIVCGPQNSHYFFYYAFHLLLSEPKILRAQGFGLAVENLEVRTE